MPAFATRCQAIHGTESVDTTAQNPIGQAARDTDGHTWHYLRGVANCSRGSVVTYDHLGQTTLLTTTSKGPVAVAGNAVPATSFGWFCVEATNSYVPGVPTKVAPNTLPNSLVGIEGPPGTVGDGRATGDQIRRFMTRAAADDYGARVLASGPSHFWRLDEASSPVLAMDSRGGAHGTVSGGVTFGQAGPLTDSNAAMTFNGSTGYINAGDVVDAAYTGAFSAEAWVRMTTAVDAAIVGKAQASGAGWLLYRTVAGTVAFRAFTTTPTLIFNLASLAGKNDGQWHHVVGTWTGTTAASGVRLYLDGVQVNQQTAAAGTPAVSTKPLLIGAHDAPAGLFFSGSIDEVALYPRVLTPYQISEHYRLRTSPSYANAVAADGASHYWRLGESGPQAIDSVGAAHGLISGGVTLGTVGATSGSSAMTFDGTTGKIAVPHAAMQPWGARSLSVEVWAKTSVTPAANTGHFLLDTTSVSTGSLGWFLDLWSDGQVYFDVVYGPTPAEYFSTKAAFPVDGAWHHIVGVLNRETGTLRVWCDGSPGPALTGIPVGVALPYPDDALLQIGQVNSTINPAFKGFNGSLDAIAFYPRALSPTEIQQHYRPDPYAALVVADGAQYYWRLAETSGTVAADLVSGLAGTISGGVTLNQPGAMSGNAAMTFDGATGKILTTAFVLPFTVTIEAWIKVTASPTYHAVFSTLGQGAVTVLFGVRTGRPVCYATDAVPVDVYGAPTTTLSNGVWYHLVLVHTGSTYSFYIDGKLDVSGVQQRSGTPPSVAGGIGADAAAGNYFSGTIDELAIYPRALTADQIRAHYEASTLTRCQFSHPFVDDAYGGAPVLLDAEPTEGPVDEEPACT